MAERFSATIERWANQTQDDLHQAFQLAVQYLLDDIIDNTPVDTGFLRASLKASTVGFAPLVDARGAIGGSYMTDDYVVTILGSEPGDVIYASYTARYAAYVENGSRGRPGRHMVKLAAQDWQAYVNRAASVVRAG